MSATAVNPGSRCGWKFSPKQCTYHRNTPHWQRGLLAGFLARKANLLAGRNTARLQGMSLNSLIGDSNWTFSWWNWSLTGGKLNSHNALLALLTDKRVWFVGIRVTFGVDPQTEFNVNLICAFMYAHIMLSFGRMYMRSCSYSLTCRDTHSSSISCSQGTDGCPCCICKDTQDYGTWCVYLWSMCCFV